ncbi:MAG: ABC transporter substrate-binding protein [Candidatus Pelagadaptatus aseana]
MSLVVLACFSGPLLAEDKTLKFAWFSSLYPEHSFWQQNWAFSKAAADDLGVELTPYYLNSDQIQCQSALKAVQKDGSYKGIIFINMKSQNQSLIELIDQGQAPAVSHTIPLDYAKTGAPGAEGSQWVAEILVDEEKSGYDLAKKLIDEAIANQLFDQDGKVQVFAIIGSKTDSVGLIREKGFLRAVGEYDNVVLHQIFYARHWSSEESYKFTVTALKRYPETTVVLSGNDDIALGVIDAARQQGRQPGRDILTGGIDGTVELMKKVRQGEAVCTVGGLFLHGAWSLVVLYDYLNGVSLDDQGGSIVRVDNTVIDRSNVGNYLQAFEQANWEKIDFTVFSKYQTPDDKGYEFAMPRIVDQLIVEQRIEAD